MWGGSRGTQAPSTAQQGGGPCDPTRGQVCRRRTAGGGALPASGSQQGTSQGKARPHPLGSVGVRGHPFSPHSSPDPQNRAPGTQGLPDPPVGPQLSTSPPRPPRRTCTSSCPCVGAAFPAVSPLPPARSPHTFVPRPPRLAAQRVRVLGEGAVPRAVAGLGSGTHPRSPELRPKRKRLPAAPPSPSRSARSRPHKGGGCRQQRTLRVSFLRLCPPRPHPPARSEDPRPGVGSCQRARGGAGLRESDGVHTRARRQQVRDPKARLRMRPSAPPCGLALRAWCHPLPLGPGQDPGGPGGSGKRRFNFYPEAQGNGAFL